MRIIVVETKDLKRAKELIGETYEIVEGSVEDTLNKLRAYHRFTCDTLDQAHIRNCFLASYKALRRMK